MRDGILYLFVFGLIPLAVRRPAYGVMMFTWISLMNPHRLTYGSAYDFPFALLLAGMTLVSLIFSREKKSLPMTPLTIQLLIFLLWMTFTCFFALEPNLVWDQWIRVNKSMLMILIAMAVLNTEQDIKNFALVCAVSIGFYGVKGGIFTVMSGGTNHVLGPDNSFIADNNALALALVIILPMIWYGYMQATNKWIKRATMGMAILTVIAAAGSYSRGALLGGGSMLFLLWIKSQQKLKTGLIIVILVPLIYAVMPDQWFARMHTINTYQQDASAMGRINAWYFSMNLVKDHFLGGGFDVFTPRMFLLYAPNPQDFHVAHSIYFQVLGEHGYIGLILFLLLIVSAWRSGSRIIKFCKNKPELKWASDLAAMIQVSTVGFCTGGAFLSLAYFDLYYDLLALLVVTEKFIGSRTERAPMRKAPIKSAVQTPVEPGNTP